MTRTLTRVFRLIGGERLILDVQVLDSAAADDDRASFDLYPATLNRQFVLAGSKCDRLAKSLDTIRVAINRDNQCRIIDNNLDATVVGNQINDETQPRTPIDDAAIIVRRSQGGRRTGSSVGAGFGSAGFGFTA